MAIEVNEGPFGNYQSGQTAANIDKLIALLTPSEVGAPKKAAEPDFSIPDAEVCRLIIGELKAIKAKV